MSLGTKIWTDPLMQVPKLEGQQVIMPRTGSDMNTYSYPVIFFRPSSIALIPLPSLSKTRLTSPPYSIDMILKWSPSLIHNKNSFFSEWKIPLPSGQCSWYPEAACILSFPLKRKWSSTSC